MTSAIDVLRWQLELTSANFTDLLASLRDHPTARSGGVGNHALWIAGHVAFIEAAVPSMLMGDARDPNPLAHLASLFAPGSVISEDDSVYPDYDELLEQVATYRAKNIALLGRLGPDSLDRKPINPPGFLADTMTTYAKAFSLIAMHMMVHSGQLLAIRRAVGMAVRF